MRNARPATQPHHPAPAATPGGASGVPHAAPATATAAAPPVTQRGPGPKPKRFRVLNGGTVVTGGCRTAIRAGKEITDQQYDVAHLRRQGIKLEPLLDEEEVAPPPEVAPEPAPVQTPPAAQ